MRWSVGFPVLWLAATACDEDHTDVTVTPVTDSDLPPHDDPPTHPSPAIIAVSPEAPVSHEGLVASLLEPPERENGAVLTVAWSWERNGLADARFLDAHVDAGVVLRGEVWTAVATAVVDEQTAAEAVARADVVVGNASPVLQTVDVAPPTPTTATPLSCLWTAEDPEGDALAATPSWFADGLPIGAGTTLAAGVAPFGSAVHCEVHLDDGFGGEDDAASDPVVVTAGPPTVVDVTLAPNPPLARHLATCSWTFEDEDGGPDQSVAHWLVDGVEQATGPSWIVDAAAGQALSCRVDPSDGVVSGTPVIATATVAEQPDNLLLIVVDDLGVDKVGAWEAHPTVPPTPSLDRLADLGRPFRFAYTHPTCSATRAALLTGRNGFQTGVGTALGCLADDHLPYEEDTLSDYLGAQGYWTEVLGKWHLDTKDFDFFESPAMHGFDRFDTTMHGFGNSCTFDGLENHYVDWEHCIDGICERSTVFNTTALVDEALARMAAMPEPWFLVLALNAPHAPYEEPPADLWSGIPVGSDVRDVQTYNAMVEATDTELGRLFDALDNETMAHTWAFVVGDNGTPDDGTDGPWDPDKTKATPFEAGVHVPLIALGPGIQSPGAWADDQLVHATDFFPTLAEIAGFPIAPDHPAAEQAVSFVPILLDATAPSARSTVYAEDFTPPGFGPYTIYQQGMRDSQYRLIRVMGEEDQLYDLSGVVVEGANLLEGELTPGQQAAYDALVAALPVNPF